MFIFKGLLIQKKSQVLLYNIYIHGVNKQLVEYSTLFLNSLFPKSNSLLCFILKQGPTRWPRLALNSWSSHVLGLQTCDTWLALNQTHYICTEHHYSTSIPYLISHSITVLPLISARNSSTVFTVLPSATCQFLLAYLLFSSHIILDYAQSALSGSSTWHCWLILLNRLFLLDLRVIFSISPPCLCVLIIHRLLLLFNF